jgi:hypothetical protein
VKGDKVHEDLSACFAKLAHVERERDAEVKTIGNALTAALRECDPETSESRDAEVETIVRDMERARRRMEVSN